MAVQQHVLNWLYSVLTSEYHDVNRTYNDVAQALSQYPSLSPRTDVHTFPNGASALLLHLSGTIPVVFRGTTYRFPISLWVPHAYPREAPLIYVTPTENMMVRPGQYVDPQGQVYHPYLVGWAEFWDKSSILDFLAILRDIFAKEPPVISRQAVRPPPPPQQTSTPPPVPPLPPDIAPQRPPSQVQSPAPAGQERPPEPPPKGSEASVQRPAAMSPAQRDGAPPPPPPPPPQPQTMGRPISQYEGNPSMPPVQSPPPPSNRAPRYDSAPPLPPQAQPAPGTRPPPAPAIGAPGRPPYQTLPPGQPQYQPGPSQQAFPQPDPRRVSSFSPPPQQFSQASPPPSSMVAPQWRQSQQPPPPLGYYQPPQQPKPKPPPPPDIMDEPLTLSIPTQEDGAVAPPPIPPNPEKDALLRQLAQTLHAMRQRGRERDESSLVGLQAQRTAMLSALGAMQAESSGLTQLTALLSSNANILREALRTADSVIEGSARRQPPAIDELLVAPTVVANQLYDLVAEERALGDAIFMLGRAVERGRVAPAVFAKMTRSLAREWYLKKALVRKIGRGMGLAGA